MVTIAVWFALFIGSRLRVDSRTRIAAPGLRALADTTAESGTSVKARGCTVPASDTLLGLTFSPHSHRLAIASGGTSHEAHPENCGDCRGHPDCHRHRTAV